MPGRDTPQRSFTTERIEGPLVWGLLAVLFAAALANAWVGDDAHITFRVLDNAVNGYGLRWNIAERVQIYTHPLWLFLLLPFYAGTREGFYTSIAVSLLCTSGALWLVSFRVARSRRSAALVLAALLGSSAFVDYATSGLENPLAYLLLALFFWALLTGPITRSRLLVLSLISCAGLLNRLDTALLFMPPLAAAVSRLDRRFAVCAVTLGFLPLAAWEAFSVFYYGFPFPNTAYAKLETGLPRADLLRQGLYYCLDSLRTDPLTFILICTGAGFGLTRRSWEVKAAAVGILLYVVYTVSIGGDFMSGRFFAAPCWVAAILLARRSWGNVRGWTIAVAAVVAAGFASEVHPVLAWTLHARNRSMFRAHGIADERGFYAPTSSLYARLTGVTQVLGEDKGREARDRRRPLVVWGMVGAAGYYAGPEVHVVDRMALGDPLLSRLPCAEPTWRIGHFERLPPSGYLESVAFSRNMVQEPHVQRVYGAILSVTRGALCDPGRLLGIWRLNTGSYSRDLQAFVRDQARDRERMLDVAEWKRLVEDRAREASAASDAMVWNALAIAHQDEGNLVVARLANLKALQLAPHSRSVATDHYLIGMYFEKAGYADMATAIFREIVAWAPGFLDAQRQLARLCFDVDLSDTTAGDLELPVRLDTGNPEACFNQGVDCQKRGLLLEAVRAYQAAVAADTTFARAYNNLGTVYMALGDYDNAIRSLENAVTLQPGYADALLNLATACRQVGRVGEARAFYEKTLSLNVGPEVAGAIRSWLASDLQLPPQRHKIEPLP